MGVFNPPSERGDYQPQALDRKQDLEEFKRRFGRLPLAKYGQLNLDNDERQADALKSAAQRPEADSLDNDSSPFQTNRDLFPSSVVNQIRGERDISAAGMKPANVAVGAQSVGKGGVISDADMNIGAAGSAINAQQNDRKYAGRPEFKRMKFYGR